MVIYKVGSDQMEIKVNKIVKWLQKQVELSKTNGLVVGVSGGLDSAVVAYLIKKAFPDNSIGAILPLKSSETDIHHAEKVVEACQINNMTIDLTETHKVMYDTIKQEIVKTNDWHEERDQLNDANLRARLRMSTLYSIATNFNYLVVGTDNLSEWYTGYFTKYGDGGVDLLPIVDLTKKEVYEMARFLGVPQEVIDKKPSADLWEDQTDEEEMGTTYDMIDSYLEGQPIPEKDQTLIENMHKRSEHKRHIPKQLLFNNQ